MTSEEKEVTLGHGSAWLNSGALLMLRLQPDFQGQPFLQLWMLLTLVNGQWHTIAILLSIYPLYHNILTLLLVILASILASVLPFTAKHTIPSSQASSRR